MEMQTRKEKGGEEMAGAWGQSAPCSGHAISQQHDPSPLLVHRPNRRDKHLFPYIVSKVASFWLTLQTLNKELSLFAGEGEQEVENEAGAERNEEGAWKEKLKICICISVCNRLSRSCGTYGDV